MLGKMRTAKPYGDLTPLLTHKYIASQVYKVCCFFFLLTNTTMNIDPNTIPTIILNGIVWIKLTTPDIKSTMTEYMLDVVKEEPTLNIAFNKVFNEIPCV